MYGERVQFRIFISDFSDGQFKGTSVDVDGYGANMDTAVINGFLTDNFISFTKQYQEYLIIESDGQITKDQSAFKPRLSYQGYYNFRSNIFEGQWELLANE